MERRTAVKACIVKDRQVLLIRRRANDPTRPGTWDVPGGRLEIGEERAAGLQREVMEEVQMTISLGKLLGSHEFIRDDGQAITMHVYACTSTDRPQTSDEAVETRWTDLPAAKQLLHQSFSPYLTELEKEGARRRVDKQT